MSERSSFGGKAGFILAAAGSAVGLGNIWRFPTLAAQHGGGTFLVVYLIIIIMFGALLLTTEIAIGRKTRKSPIDAFTALRPSAKWIGILAVVVPTIILPYYCVIGGWVVSYLGTYLIGGTATGATFFGDLVGSWIAVVAFLIFFGVTMAVIWLGVTNGIERLSKIFMPLLLILVIGLTIYVLLQPEMAGGITYYVSFNWSDVDSETFTAALGQAFFSLSLAMGIMITYGSYMKKDENIENCAFSIGIIDTCVAMICGLMIVPMAFSMYGKADMPAGAGLVFNSLPQIFDGMTGAGIVAIIFFILLFIAAWTSSISIAEAIISTIMDKTGMSRRRAVVVLTIPMIIAGIIICMGYGPLDFITFEGQTILDMLDNLANKIIMPIVAFSTCILIGHIVGCKVVIDEVESSGRFKLKMFYPLIVKWVAPVCIAVIFITGFW